MHLEALTPENFQVEVGSTLELGAKVWSSGMPLDQIALEIVAGIQDESGHIMEPQVVSMTANGQIDGAVLYHGTFQPNQSGQIAIGVRARPNHKALINRYETGLNRWA